MTTTTTPRGARRTAIRAGRLFDGTGRATTPDPLVLVEDGRISAVESGARQPLPPDAELIELPGATLLPGLIDTHVHLCFDASRTPVEALAERDTSAALGAMAEAATAQLLAGVTTVRDLGDRDYLALTLRGSGAPAGAGPLPTVLAAGPPITSAGGHCHFLGGEASGVAGLRAAVRAHAERGVDVIKVMASGGQMTPGSVPHEAQFSAAELAAVVDEAHRHGLPVTAHAHALESIGDAVEAGVDGIEHCAFRTAEGIVVPDELVAAIAARRIAIGATVGIVAVAGVEPPPELLRLLPMVYAALARLHRAGAVMVVGSDAGIAPVKPHGVLPHGLAMLAELGWSAAEALHAGTGIAARVCGLGDRKGRIAAGYDADLLAVAGDPLADLAALLRPVAVLAGGRAVALTDPAAEPGRAPRPGTLPPAATAGGPAHRRS